MSSCDLFESLLMWPFYIPPLPTEVLACKVTQFHDARASLSIAVFFCVSVQTLSLATFMTIGRVL